MKLCNIFNENIYILIGFLLHIRKKPIFKCSIEVISTSIRCRKTCNKFLFLVGKYVHATYICWTTCEQVICDKNRLTKLLK